MWSSLLKEIDLVQKSTQTEGLAFDVCMSKLKGLERFMIESKNVIVERSIQSAKSICEELDIDITQRIKRRKKMPGETASDAGLDLVGETKRSMIESIDRFQMEMTTRIAKYTVPSTIFALLHASVLIHGNENAIDDAINELSIMKDKVEIHQLKIEIERLRRHLRLAEKDLTGAQDILSFIVQWDLQEAVPNLVTLFRIFLTMSVSVASCERSFSKLKLIKNYLRSTMSQARIDSLAVLSIERQLVDTIDFDQIIDEFAAKKVRRVIFK